jgi:hypothetical protein
MIDVMFTILAALLRTLRSALHSRTELALENLVLRQQLATLRQSAPRLRLRPIDRAFWALLSRIWSRWADALVVVKPDTVVRWHRAGFRLFWRWKSRGRTPAEGDVSPEVRQLIRRMAEANVTWGAPKIHGELLKLGIVISERSVSRFMPKRPPKPQIRPPYVYLGLLLGLFLPASGGAVSGGRLGQLITATSAGTRWRRLASCLPQTFQGPSSAPGVPSPTLRWHVGAHADPRRESSLTQKKSIRKD